MPLEVVVLAAGYGKRMRSRIPKVFHNLLGKPMLSHVLDTLRKVEADQIHVVIRAEMQKEASQIFGDGINWVHQLEPKGTGHAVLQALPHIATDSRVLVVNGDAPLISEQTLSRTLVEDSDALTIVTAELDDPTGYGRISRDSQNRVCGIVEERDATREQKQIREVNSGAMVAPARILRTLLAELGCANAQGEYYLTDIVKLAVEQGICVNTVNSPNPEEVVGVNDRNQLAQTERALALRRAEEAMAQGVSLRDPSRFDLRGTLTAGVDCCIDLNVILEGEVVLGDDVTVGPGCILRDVEIGDGVELHEYCIVESASIGKNCSIGPLARIRPGSVLDDEVRIGNFVEVKASNLAKGTRANHLAYIGDADVGEHVNVGAGAITCNFDGASKHRTVLGDNVFVGTNCTMVAPLKVESGAFLAAGSTITSDVTGNVLAVGRARQRIISRWIAPKRRKKS